MGEQKQIVYTQEEAKLIVDAFLTATEDVKTQRADDFSKYQRFVLDGEQWQENEKPEGDKPVLTFNQSEDHITTYLSKLFPRNLSTGTMQVGVKVQGAEKEKAEKEILDTYKANKFAGTILEQGQNFLVGGDGCFYYPQDPISKKAKIISLNPASVYLGWNGQELSQFAFEDEISLADVEDTKQNWLITAIKNFIKDETAATRKFKKTKRITYWDKTCQIIKVDDSYKVTKNETGLIPFSWIPNMPKAHKHEGFSEAKKLFNLEVEYNKRASDFGQRVKSNTKPSLAAYTEKTVKDLDVENLGGILTFAPGDKAEFLKLTEDQELLSYLDMLSKQMAKKMSVNDAVNGDIKSNVSSLSMIYYFSPLMDRIGLKRVFWDEAFRELNRAILTYAELDATTATDPVYEPVVLTDLKTKIDNTVAMLTNGLISHEDAIDELRGSENATEKLKLIVEDIKKFDSLKPQDQVLTLG